MGLDWCVMSRTEEDGTEVTPGESLGAKRLDRNDPETVEQFKAVVKSHTDAIAKGSTNEGHAEFWSRPFEELLDELEGRVLPVDDDRLPSFCGTGSFAAGPFDWRGKRLSCIEDLDVDLKDRAYFDMDPAQALEYADDLEDAAEGLALDEDKETVTEAVAFLRFWGEKGHGINAWY